MSVSSNYKKYSEKLLVLPHYLWLGWEDGGARANPTDDAEAGLCWSNERSNKYKTSEWLTGQYRWERVLLSAQLTDD